ncbi:MAG: hypothetical protein ABS43_12250 [Bordetella sp. SCN 67-23]|nr:MAG: hypothetical protein ABS43_12250 [Bordetella sp. SCN 67-23]ODU72491.1 MAG: hypothetical protein ABT00_17670 [Bordetella sp. SCN 68-11]OJW92743.1 MAG: hypothetical protein BGO71_23555 [Burkholderiales bacterium 67-32]
MLVFAFVQIVRRHTATVPVGRVGPRFAIEAGQRRAPAICGPAWQGRWLVALFTLIRRWPGRSRGQLRFDRSKARVDRSKVRLDGLKA